MRAEIPFQNSPQPKTNKMSNLLVQQKTAPAAQPLQKPSALNFMAGRLNIDSAKLLSILKSTVFKGATDDELGALVIVSNEYDLNPLLKEIYAFPAKGGGIVPIVSVDGWNKMLIRQPSFDGIEFEFADGEDGNPYSCTATIHIKGRTHPVKLTEYFDECFRQTDPWKNMPRRMLRNRTLCQASRLAFGFSGVTNDDEAATYIDVAATPVPSDPPPKMVTLPPREVVKTPQEQLESIYIEEGFTFTDMVKWLKGSGNFEDADSLTAIIELPREIAARLVKAKTGLLKGLADLKAATT